MRILRILLAAVSLATMVILFVAPTAMVAATAGWLARAQVMPAIMAGSVIIMVILAVLTALFGRVYCSVMCPLGIVQDMARFVLKYLRFKPITICTWVRYAILALYIVGACLGFAVVLDPYGIFGRFMSVVALKVGSSALAIFLWALVTFGFILLMTAFRARWWCNQVCPVGSLLGLGAQFAIFRVRIDHAKCVNCNLCVKACDKGCISAEKDKKVNNSQCVMCFRCARVCHGGALTFQPKK